MANKIGLHSTAFEKHYVWSSPSSVICDSRACTEVYGTREQGRSDGEEDLRTHSQKDSILDSLELLPRLLVAKCMPGYLPSGREQRITVVVLRQMNESANESWRKSLLFAENFRSLRLDLPKTPTSNFSFS